MARVFKMTRQLRSNDFDRLGHLNQSVYHVLLEDVRIEFARSLLEDRLAFVLVHGEIDHRREIDDSNDEVEVAVWVTKHGRSSFVMAQEVRMADGTLAAEGHVVLVVWDRERRGSRPLTDSEREALTAAGAAATAAPI